MGRSLKYFQKKKKNRKLLTFGKVATGISIFRYFLGGSRGGFKKRVKWSIFAFLAGILISVQPARAIIGIGDTVFDSANYMQNVMNYIQHIMNTLNQVQQTSNQLESLANEARHLASMDAASAASTLSNLRSSLTRLMQLQSNIRGLTMEYQSVEKAFDSLYGKFADFNGMSGADYAAQAQKVLDQTNNATYDAMRAQGLVSELGNDAQNLETLLNASNTSGGALSAAQAGNAIAALNTKQLLRLQQIAASSYRAESSYLAQQANKEAMSKADSDRFYGDKMERPLQGAGKGRKTKQY